MFEMWVEQVNLYLCFHFMRLNKLIMTIFILVISASACTASRSQSAKNEFKKLYPCPANGNNKGACPGYVIDHIKPLACGGEDAPVNMQWQTTADGKAKDKWERKNCQP